ncbi:MAG: MBL fold metallo-hydrolase [Deltaproteobacteria bacterium]|nr:MBL fold metallo-hydrolase [Deltaproteobacteria bacterium]
MKIIATVICENCVFNQPGAIAEHGLSIYMETDCGSYLLDTGQGKAVINNALVLGLDLRAIKGIIMSHHHWDHTGGLGPILDLKGAVDIYAHPDFFKESYNIGEGKVRYIGVPYPRPLLEGKGAAFKFSNEFRQIEPGMWLTGEVPRRTDYERGDKNQVVKSNGGYLKDDILDDQSVVIETEKGLFIILGCCHSGIINTLSYIVEKMGQCHIYAVIGGTHLGPVSDEQREKSIDALKAFDIEHIGVSHCTGLKTATRLAGEFGDRFFFCNVGTVVEA